jgi:hypothetical protein
MTDTLRIVGGAVFTVLWCWAAGRLLLRRVHGGFSRAEENLLAVPSGAACVSLFVFALCAAGLARRGILQWSGAATIAAALWTGRGRVWKGSLPRLPRVWWWALGLVFASFFWRYFLHALAPEVSPDGSGYHLGNVARIWREHGFVWGHHNMYSYLSQGMEMLFLVAFGIGRHSAAAMVHLAFQTVLPWLMVTFGLRTGHGRAGVFAAVAVYVSPVVGLDGAVAYNDVGLAAVLFTTVYLLEVWREERSDKLLFVLGLLCGFAYGIKYTAGVFTPLAAGLVGYTLWRAKMPLARSLAVLAAGIAVTAGPWVVRNWIWLSNPLAPFYNAWFPNPYYHPGMEQTYRDGLSGYEGIAEVWRIPLELTTLGGGGVGGILGPVFLLAPLALLALRYRVGRLMLLVAVVLALPATQNIGARFLIPTLPFLAMAIGLAIMQTPGAIALLAAFHVVLCWPGVLSTYCHKHAWRLGPPRADAAFRRIPEADWVKRHSPEVALSGQIDVVVPPDRKLFSFAGRPEAYLNREIAVSYQSVEANLINDILLAPIHAHKPTSQRRFAFAAREVAAVRVVQTASSKTYWSVVEMRVYRAEREVHRDPKWQVAARPNGWEAQLAFDNSPVTRWQSWEGSRPGQFLELRFDRPMAIDRVVVESAGEGHSKLRLEGRGSDGKWQVLAAAPEIVEIAPPRGMRLAATREVKARGVTYLLIQDSDAFWEDVSKHERYWGITREGQAGGTFLYRIN